jgi:hypothetical protein
LSARSSAAAQRNRRVVGVRVERGEERSTLEKEHLLSASVERVNEKLKKQPGDKKAATQVNSMNSSSP